MVVEAVVIVVAVAAVAVVAVAVVVAEVAVKGIIITIPPTITKIRTRSLPPILRLL